MKRKFTKYPSSYVKASIDMYDLFRTYKKIRDCFNESGRYLDIYVNKAADDKQKLRQYDAATKQLKDTVDSALQVFDAQIDGINEGRYISIKPVDDESEN